MPCPVVLCACDGLYGCQLGQRRDLAENAGDDDEEAPDQCSWTAVPVNQANVPVLPSACVPEFSSRADNVRRNGFPTGHVTEGEAEHLGEAEDALLGQSVWAQRTGLRIAYSDTGRRPPR